MINLHEICCWASSQICFGLVFVVYFLYNFSLKLSQPHQTISFPPETPSLHVTIWEDRSIVPQRQQTAKPFFLLGTLSLGKVGLPVKWLHHFFHSKTTKITESLWASNWELAKWWISSSSMGEMDAFWNVSGFQSLLHWREDFFFILRMLTWNSDCSISSKSTGDPTKM